MTSCQGVVEKPDYMAGFSTRLTLPVVEGLPVLEATTLEGMAAGVLVGLLIADSAQPSEELDFSTFPVR